MNTHYEWMQLVDEYFQLHDRPIEGLVVVAESEQEAIYACPSTVCDGTCARCSLNSW